MSILDFGVDVMFVSFGHPVTNRLDHFSKAFTKQERTSNGPRADPMATGRHPIRACHRWCKSRTVPHSSGSRIIGRSVRMILPQGLPVRTIAFQTFLAAAWTCRAAMQPLPAQWRTRTPHVLEHAWSRIARQTVGAEGHVIPRQMLARTNAQPFKRRTVVCTIERLRARSPWLVSSRLLTRPVPAACPCFGLHQIL